MYDFGQYIVYVDESGDHSLRSINPDYPIFVLLFCIIDKEDYLDWVVPRIQDLKFRYFGHDMVVLHEADIRKSRPPFEILMNTSIREQFMEDLSGIMKGAPVTLVASCIMKEEFARRRGTKDNPYHVAMEFGLERVFMDLQGRGERGRTTHVIFEQRGKQEDDALELEFRRIMDQSWMAGMDDTLEMVLASKKANSAGLQLADMMARPVGRYLLSPDQPNRAFEILRGKFRQSPDGEVRGWGLKVYP